MDGVMGMRRQRGGFYSRDMNGNVYYMEESTPGNYKIHEKY